MACTWHLVEWDLKVRNDKRPHSQMAVFCSSKCGLLMLYLMHEGSEPALITLLGVLFVRLISSRTHAFDGNFANG